MRDRARASADRRWNRQHRNTIWRAFVETRHFDFEAFAMTAEEAKASLVAGLRAHAAQYGETDGGDRMVDAFAGSIETHQITIGAAYRDRQPL